MRERRVLRRAAQATQLCSLSLPQIQAPIFVRPGSTDITVFEQVFCREELIFEAPTNIDFIIDAGANIGLMSIYLTHCFPEAKIVALEVEASNFELLCRNVEPYPKITPVFKGLWSKRTRLAIDNPHAPKWAFSVSETTDQIANTIDAISIADIMIDFQVDRIGLLKMDVEGAEIEILSAGCDAWADKVDAIAVELHERKMRGCSAALEEFIKRYPFERKCTGEYVMLTRERS